MINKTVGFLNKIKPHLNDIFWSNVNQVVQVLSALTVSVVFARLAGKEIYGQYLFVLAFFGLFSVISIPGVKTVIFKTAAQGYEGVYSRATKFSFIWSLLGVPILIVTGLFFYLFKTKVLGICLIACALFFPFVTSLQTWMLFLKGRSQFKKLTIYNSIKFLINLLALATAIIFTGKIVIILLVYFLVNSSFNIFCHLKVLSLLRNNKVDSGWRTQSYALTIMDLSSIIFGRVDVVLLGAMLPIGQVAVYGLVMKFVDVFFKGIKSTMEAIAPSLFKSKKITVRYFYKFFLLSFLIPIILFPIVKYPILLLYGREYSQVIAYSQVYLIVMPFYFLNIITTYFLIKYKLNKEINLSRIASIIAVVVLYVILIPLYGIWGGVVASILYFMIQLVMNLFFLKIRKPKYIGG